MRAALAASGALLGAALWVTHTSPAFVAAPCGAEVSPRGVSPNTPATPANVLLTRVSRESEAGASFAHAAGAAALVLAGAALASAVGRKRDARNIIARRGQNIITSPDQAFNWWERRIRNRTEPGMGIWAEKVNMTQCFVEENGNYMTVPATVLAVKRGGNIVTGKKWPERDGYFSVQVGYDRYVPEEWEYDFPKYAVKLAELKRSGVPPLRKLKEFRVRPQHWPRWTIGDKVCPSDIFEEGDLLNIHGVSKGKGLQGVIKKWNFNRGPMSHGSKHHRRSGAVGGGTDPGRIFPGHHMPGWTGDKKCVRTNAKILKMYDRIDEDNMPESIIIVRGGVPGYNSFKDEEGGSYVYMNKALNWSDGRYKRDPVYKYYFDKDGDPEVPLKGHAWTWKTMYGRDARWYYHEIKKFWPDGYPGVDHSGDPFYDDCDPRMAKKAPEW